MREKPLGGLASAVSDDVWRTLLSYGNKRAYVRGQLLMQQGEPADHVVILLTGTVKVSIADGNGSPLVLALRGVGDVVGEIGLLGETIRSATVTAVTRCESHVVEASRFNDLVRSLGVETIVLRHLVQRLRDDEELRAATVARPAGLRVTRGLMYLARRAVADAAASRTVELSLQQTDLADALRLSRQTVTAELSKLRREGIVATLRGRIVVLNIDELRRCSERNQQ